MAHLQVICGKIHGRRVKLDENEVTVGRDGTNTIVLDDPGVLPRHCSIRLAEDGCRLHSLASIDGLLVNGLAVAKAMLQHGDVVTIGSSDLIYSVAEVEPVAPEAAAGPRPFVPQPPSVPLLRRILWPFTRLGRASRSLLHAYERPEGPRYLESVAKALAGLPADQTRGKPAEEEMALELGIYLAWQTLSLGDFGRCSSSLAYLDSHFPTSPSRTALRWDLLGALWKAGAMEPYVQEAKLFTANAGASEAVYSSAVQEVIRLLYEAVSPAQCASVLQQAHPSLQKKTEIQTVRQLCACPAFFKTADEGRQWTARVQPEKLTFSRVMKADAHLVRVRAAEVDRDWNAMVRGALDVLPAAPAHRPVLYWLARARLQTAAADPGEHLGPATQDEGNEWKRIRLLIALHTQPSLAHVQPAATLLNDAMGKADRGEKILTVKTVHRALQTRPPSTLSEVDLAARICLEIEKAAGELSWTQAMIAYKEARVDREYTAAYLRAEKPKVGGEPGASRTARTSRLLAGCPRPPSDDSRETVLSTFENAFWRLLGRPGKGMALQDSALGRQLEAAENSEECAQFPDLKPAAALMALALRVLAGDVEPVWCAVRNVDLGVSTPAWIGWLRARTFLLAWMQCEPAAPIPASLVSDPAAAFAIERATRNHDLPRALDQQAAARLDAVMEAWLAQQDNPRGETVRWIRHARVSGYRACADFPSVVGIESIFPELGELPDVLCASEARLEIGYTQARCALAAGEPEHAVRRFRALIKDVAGTPPLTAAYWEPLLRYWLGVAQAHAGDGQAGANLEAVAAGNGTKALSARGQLALLAIQQGDIDRAGRWIDGVSPNVPSVRYAKALTLARRNEGASARQLLDSEDARSVLADSAYAAPAQRLVAAVEERAGNREQSDYLHGVLLMEHPHDEVASVRLARGLLHDAYARFRTDGASESWTVPNLLQKLIPRIKTHVTWWPPYVLLYKLMAAPGNSLESLDETVTSMFGGDDPGFAWRQMLATRHLLAGRPNDALRILAVPRSHNIPPWFQRTRLLLRTWREVTRLADEISCGEALKELGQCLRAFNELDASDAAAIRWRTLAEIGLSLGGDAVPAATARWREIAPHPMAEIPFLFDADSRSRRAAAEALSPVLERGEARWSEPQRRMLQALAAWNQEMDDAFLEQYGRLEPLLEALPAPACNLWASAALIRYARADWKSLTGDRLPPCLAEMSDPLVCLIIELTDVCVVAGDLKNPNQRVAQKVKDIQRNLAALLKGLDSQATESTAT